MTYVSTFLAGSLFPGRLIAERKRERKKEREDELYFGLGRGRSLDRIGCEAFLAQSVFRFGLGTD